VAIILILLKINWNWVFSMDKSQEQSEAIREMLNKPAGRIAQLGIYVILLGVFLIAGITWLIPYKETLTMSLAITGRADPDSDTAYFSTAFTNEKAKIGKNIPIIACFTTSTGSEVNINGVVDSSFVYEGQRCNIIRLETRNAEWLRPGMIGTAKVELGKTSLLYQLVKVFYNPQS
jgi:hypothetical protein